jgi:hypothetical protein
MFIQTFLTLKISIPNAKINETTSLYLENSIGRRIINGPHCVITYDKLMNKSFGDSLIILIKVTSDLAFHL